MEDCASKQKLPQKAYLCLLSLLMATLLAWNWMMKMVVAAVVAVVKMNWVTDLRLLLLLCCCCWKAVALLLRIPCHCCYLSLDRL